MYQVNIKNHVASSVPIEAPTITFWPCVFSEIGGHSQSPHNGGEYQHNGSQSKQGGLDGQKIPWGLDSSAGAKKNWGSKINPLFWQTISKFAKPATMAKQNSFKRRSARRFAPRLRA